MKKTKLIYEEKIKWFIQNYYETGMEYEHMLNFFKNKDLNNFYWYNKKITFPKFKK